MVILHLPEWGVIGSLAFLAVIVSDIVGVVLLELVVIDLGREGALPEGEGLLEGQSDGLEEEAVLLAAVVLQMVLLAELPVEMLHAEREMRRGLVDVGGREDAFDEAFGGVDGRGGVGGLDEVEERKDTVVTEGGQLLGGALHLRLELLLEAVGDDGEGLGLGDEGVAAVQEDAAPADQVGHHLEGHDVEGLVGGRIRGRHGQLPGPLFLLLGRGHLAVADAPGDELGALLRRSLLKARLEEGRLVGDEPADPVRIAAVRQAQDVVAQVVPSPLLVNFAHLPAAVLVAVHHQVCLGGLVDERAKVVPVQIPNHRRLHSPQD